MHFLFSSLSGANEDSDERPNYCTVCTEDSAEVQLLHSLY